MVEYALLVGVIAGVAIVAASGVGPIVALKFELVVAGFEGAP
ncbi:hypothetical protein [Paludisphaera soli]|nr:hypothetical protein [Paludisphaera soli]